MTPTECLILYTMTHFCLEEYTVCSVNLTIFLLNSVVNAYTISPKLTILFNKFNYRVNSLRSFYFSLLTTWERKYFLNSFKTKRKLLHHFFTSIKINIFNKRIQLEIFISPFFLIYIIFLKFKIYEEENEKSLFLDSKIIMWNRLC